jgi:RNA polymerase sigma-70 factor (ECF subfamily)
MNERTLDLATLLDRAAAQDPGALGELFELHRERLRRMVHLRMDRRLHGRLDPSDVLQEAFLEYARSLPSYFKQPDVPFYLWLRCLTGRKLHALHRRHLGTQMRDAGREVSLHAVSMPGASSVSLAAQLLGKLTAPSQAALRAELQAKVQQALNDMEPLDREVLALRHYEQLNNQETAQVLGVSEAAASVRFIRALRRLREHLKQIPGLLGDAQEADASEALGAGDEAG